MANPRILVLGGGYAGLAAVAALRRHAPNGRIVLIAPRKAHIEVVKLHETLRYSLARLCVPYAGLAARYGFEFVRGKLKFSPESLARWNERRRMTVESREIPFDRLIVATGAAPVAYEPCERLLGLEDFRLGIAQNRIRALCERREPPAVAVVGGGATGVQFLFEVAECLRRHARPGWTLHHVHGESRVLARLPAAFHDYASERMRSAGIARHGGLLFAGLQDRTLRLTPRDGGETMRLSADLTLLFAGVKPNPFPMETDAFGRIVCAGETLERVFAAGDCARFAGPGANALSAQVAAQKGRAAALNALGARRPYDYAEKGYFVSLGPSDGIGWLGEPDRIVSGLPALLLKKAAETRGDPLSL